MNTSISWPEDGESASPVRVIQASGFPPPSHPAEADVFARHEGLPAHNQEVLSGSSILTIGAGGLGSWAALGLLRSGVRHLTIVDGDRFDRTNAPRQLMFDVDTTAPKAFALAENLTPHMIAGGTLTAVALAFEEVVDQDLALASDVLLCLVDNNRCRWAAARYARNLAIPAVFTMLSLDGMRVHCFLQGPAATDACLWCALPNLEVESSTPCAAGVITSCLAAAALTVFFTHRALMGWPELTPAFNWRELDLLGMSSERTGSVRRRSDCECCSLSVADGPAETS